MRKRGITMRKRWKQKTMAVIVTVALMGGTIHAVPVMALNNTNQVVTSSTSKTSAWKALSDTIKTAEDLSVRVSIKKYQTSDVEEFEWALKQAKSIEKKNSIVDINSARLYLQVAMDSLKIDLEKVSISEIQSMIKEGTLTYEELVNMYLTRIDLYDIYSVGINAIRVVNSHAIEEAKECDEAVAKDKSLAAGMYGIPVIIKDNIDTKASDGMPTTAGSVALARNYATDDAEVVKAITSKGAIILAKTNLSEFANFITSGMKNGYSTLGGQVWNPYKPGVLDVSGSSSGTGAGIAAGLATIGIGTETSGSILSPGYQNSLVALKPTCGLISGSGIIPLSHSQDVAGPMGRSVSDVATFLSAMQTYDADNHVWLDEYLDYENISTDSNTYYDSVVEADYTQYLNTDYLNGKRIGVWNVNSNKDIKRIQINSFNAMVEKGATIVFRTTIDNVKYYVEYSSEGLKYYTLSYSDESIYPQWNEVAAPGDYTIDTITIQALETGYSLYKISSGSVQADSNGNVVSSGGTSYGVLYLDFKLDITNYFLSHPNVLASDGKTAINSLTDVIEYNKKATKSSGENPGCLKYGQTILEDCDTLEGMLDSTSEMYMAYLEARDKDETYSREYGIDYALKAYHLDFVSGVNGGTTGTAAKAGYPSITVPAGYCSVENNMQCVNIQFTAGAFEEEKLIAAGYSFEQATVARRAPGLADKSSLKAAIEDALDAGLENEDAYKEAVEAYESNFTTQYEAASKEEKLITLLYPEKTEEPTEESTKKLTEAPTVAPTTTVKVPSKVKNVKAKNIKGKKIKVTWKNISKVTGYQVSINGKKYTVKKKVYISKKLKKGKTYKVKVRAYNKVKSMVKYGKWSNVKKIKIKK